MAASLCSAGDLTQRCKAALLQLLNKAGVCCLQEIYFYAGTRISEKERGSVFHVDRLSKRDGVTILDEVDFK